MVLTQLGEVEPECVENRFHTTMVLTQPGLFPALLFYRSSFHTTMVLTQREQLRWEADAGIPFPYHYGSHATGVPGEYFIGQEVFPYHYGSHATSSLWMALGF